MDLGLIFRTTEPLKRLPFFIGILIVNVVCIPLYFVGGIFTDFSAAIFVIWICSVIFFILRRLIDIGFNSFLGAGLTVVFIAFILYVLTGIHPGAGKIGSLAYWGFLLLTPTGWAVKKTEPPPW